jgi:hypothetical protein
MKIQMTTSITDKANILADLWLNYRQDEEFQDFVEYNDIGLPLAYVLSNNIVQMTPMAEQFVNETFELFLAGLGLDDDDVGFQTLDDILGSA